MGVVVAKIPRKIERPPITPAPDPVMPTPPKTFAEQLNDHFKQHLPKPPQTDKIYTWEHSNLGADPATQTLAEAGHYGSKLDMLRRGKQAIPKQFIKAPFSGRENPLIRVPRLGDFLPAAAGIIGAGRALTDTPEERQDFQRSVGVESPLGSVAADGFRTMSHVGNALTSGGAGWLGQQASDLYSEGPKAYYEGATRGLRDFFSYR